MNLLQRFKRKYNYLLDKKYLTKQSQLLLEDIKANKEKAIYFFCTPMHSNLGDQAQYFCWQQLLKRDLPDFHIISIPAKICTDEILRAIKDKATADDKFVVHSGYLIFDPHPELPFICKVVDMFHERHITILPQTINLISADKKKEVGDSFNSHPSLNVISRDEISFQNAQTLFPQCSQLLKPDVVTTLIDNTDFNFNHDGKRDGVLFCMRNDGEKFYKKSEIDALKKCFKGKKVIENDTTITLPQRYWAAQRAMLIKQTISDFARYQLVITDRYHGTIFSQIANTPVVVLRSTDHKLTSGVTWFPHDVFGENVFIANNLDECFEIALKVLARNGRIVANPPYFMENYYNERELFKLL